MTEERWAFSGDLCRLSWHLLTLTFPAGSYLVGYYDGCKGGADNKEKRALGKSHTLLGMFIQLHPDPEIYLGETGWCGGMISVWLDYLCSSAWSSALDLEPGCAQSYYPDWYFKKYGHSVLKKSCFFIKCIFCCKMKWSYNWQFTLCTSAGISECVFFPHAIFSDIHISRYIKSSWSAIHFIFFEVWGVKCTAQGLSGNVASLPNMGFDPATFWSQVQRPDPLSQTEIWNSC